MRFIGTKNVFISIAARCVLIVTLIGLPLVHANNIRHAQQQQQFMLDGLSPAVLKAAVNAYRWAVRHHAVANPWVLTIVDFNKPSYEKRLWVIDLKKNRVLMHVHVAQGHDGGVAPTRFSNQPGSHESSPGIFTTVGDRYTGEHGVSLRIKGLEKGINDNALSRAVVIHAASYVTPDFIREMGRAGRSWGCFAVNPVRIKKLIQLIHGGSVLFAYTKLVADHDSIVNHRLSSAGQRLYDHISHAAPENFFERFFDSL